MKSETRSDDANTGHGHVYPRPDGVKTRCGGPGLCSVCGADLARKLREEGHAPTEPVVLLPPDEISFNPTPSCLARLKDAVDAYEMLAPGKWDTMRGAAIDRVIAAAREVVRGIV